MDGDVHGGSAESGSGTATATGNSVSISGGTAFGGGAGLYGGYAEVGGNPSGDAFTGNTLNLWNTSGITVASVQNFQFFNFRIPSTRSGPVLAVTGTATLDDGAGKGSTVTAINTGGPAAIPAGSSVTLIKATALRAADFSQTHTQGRHGAFIRYLWALDTANNALTATAVNVQVAPETKVLSEGAVAGVTLVNQGADLVAGDGIANARSAAGNSGAGSFGALSGGWSRYNTGSHVDVSGLSLIAGLSFGADVPPGRLTVGAFLEYGTGAYDTWNSFGTMDARGDGDMYNLGGGFLGRMDFLDTGPGNFYAEASFRAGEAHNEYRTSALRDDAGNSVRGYESSSTYYGLHLGAGYLWKFTDQASLDLYGKYFWTRQQGDSVTLATGDPVEFKDTDSRRVRLGGRFAYAVNEYLAPYIGAAYEHEFDGKARASISGIAIDAPTLRGDTGIGELGLTLTPSKDLPLSFDVGVQGYAGKREGLTGSLQARLEF